MATAAKTKPRRAKRRPMFMPYDKSAAASAVVQPLPGLEHLSDDEVFDVLTKPDVFEAVMGRPPEKWYRDRFVAEVGRSEGRFKTWVSNFYRVQRGVDPQTIKDRIMAPPDGYDKRSPWWYETTARAWAIEEGLHTRRGVLIPYKPTGRPKGRTDSRPRTRVAPMQADALAVLAAVEKLIAGGASLAEAKAAIAEREGLTGKQVARRLTAGRTMRAAGVRPITPETPPNQANKIIITWYRLLMADGRRTREDNARAEIADQLGLERETVDVVIDEVLARQATTRT